MIKRKSLPGPGSNKYDSELESFAIMFTQKQYFINTRTSDFPIESVICSLSFKIKRAFLLPSWCHYALLHDLITSLSPRST